MRPGALRHQVRIYQIVSQTGEVTSEQTPSPVWAAIEPSSPGTSITDRAVTHLVTVRYHAGITLDTMLLFGSRRLFVRGVQNLEERGIEMRLLCEEIV